MRPHDGESYEQWIERVRIFEYGYALQQIAKGQDPIVVMEAMSARMMKKMLHPIMLAIKESTISNYDPVKSRLDYEEKYLKNRVPVADHVDGQIFLDKDQ